MGEHQRQRRRTGPGAATGVAGLAGDQGPAETAVERGEQGLGELQGGRAEPGGLPPASGSGVRNKTGINRYQPGSGPLPIAWASGRLAEPVALGLELAPGKAVGFWEEGFGGER